jgi:hypothetical protein
VKRVRVERSRKFGGPWLGRELLRRLELDRFLEERLPNGREEIPWSAMAMILILGRLCEPSSELHLAEHLYEASAMSDLLGVPEEKVNEDRLYRALDILLPHKKALEKLLKERLGERFDVRVEVNAQGFTQLRWTKVESWRDWARRSEGCYLLRSNVIDWTPEELWRAYVQLTEAEAAFRVHKSDLQIRPVCHHREHRVGAHILVCFLAYVLWKTLAASCRQGGLGDEPRQVFEELCEISLVDVVLPTRQGVEVRKRRIVQPTEHQRILLQRLGMRLPIELEQAQM